MNELFALFWAAIDWRIAGSSGRALDTRKVIGETRDEADFLVAFNQHSYQDLTIADKKLGPIRTARRTYDCKAGNEPDEVAPSPGASAGVAL